MERSSNTRKCPHASDRRYLGGFTLVAMTCALLLLPADHARGRERVTRVLADRWHIRQLDSPDPDIAELTQEAARSGHDWLTAKMPAQVHDILLAHGKITDPRIGQNAAESAWVGETDWAYTCIFQSPAGTDGPVFLHFEGLDTLAAAWLNGKLIGRFDNMYRQHVVDVRSELSSEGRDNVLLIVFSSPLRFIEQIEQSPQEEGIAKAHYLRKCHSDFGSYLGARPHSVKVGVFRDVWLDLPGESWIDDVNVRPRLSSDYARATVDIAVTTSGTDCPLSWTVTGPGGVEVAAGEAVTKSGTAAWQVQIDKPRLWWPSTHGTPHLYELETCLGGGVRALDRRTLRFGIRDIQPVLEDPARGEKRFRFDINGSPIFLRGACLAPVEGMTHCWDQGRASKLLDLMQHGRMNVLRIWGEGNLPPQEFYDECDRRGILIWQDFMFGYGMHPTQERSFVENCRVELEQMIRRLRNHPCLLLWCGGNENHMGWDFRYGTKPEIGNELFERVMPEAVARLDPDRLFHPSSPHGGRVPNWPLEGDWHDYSTLKFCPEASVPLYASEVGRASAPSLTSMRRFLSDEDLWPEGFDPAIRTPGQAAWPPMWQYRSVGGSWDKVGPLERFCDPKTPEELIRVLGTAHGEYLRERVERQRRGVPNGQPDGNRRCWGNMVWRLNDSWPIIYWAVIDYYLEPKIPYYFLRRAYDPVLLSFEQTDDQIAVWVVNDSPEPVSGRLTVWRKTFKGQVRGELSTDVELQPGQAKRCLSTTDFGPVYLRTEFLDAQFAGREAIHLLIGERYLHLPEAKLSAKMVDGGIELSTDLFARQVALQRDGNTALHFDDNFFDMPPGSTKTIRMLEKPDRDSISIRALNAKPVQIRW